MLPLGSAALAGTTFPIDRDAVAARARLLGVSPNSLDAVSDRDFLVDLTYACTLGDGAPLAPGRGAHPLVER